MLSLKEAKEFCRIDNDDEDALIKTLINTADSYIAEACGENYNKDSEKAKLCQAMLVNHWYENRDILGNKKEIAKRNFVAGIFRGIGIGIGVTIITAIIIYFLQKLVRLNLPGIGKYIYDIVEIVESLNK